MRICILYNVVRGQRRGFPHDRISDDDVMDTVRRIEEALGDRHDVVPLVVSREVLSDLNPSLFDVVLNLCEGFDGEVRGEAWVAAALEMAGLVYTGSDPLTLGLCLDKIKTKHILRANGLKTPPFQLFLSSNQKLDPSLRFPLIVKPFSEDASVGITTDSVVQNRLELFKRVEFILNHYSQGALVEEYIEGRELNAAVMGNGCKVQVLPISEVVFRFDDGRPRIVDYEAKWMEGSDAYKGTVGVCPADLSTEAASAIRKAALEAYRLLGCRDYARVDFRLRDNIPYILEVNPNPGINTDSGFARSSAAGGMSYGDLIERIIHFALTRHGIPPKGSDGEVKEKVLWGSDLINLRYVGFRDLDMIMEWFNDPEISVRMDDPGRTYDKQDLIRTIILNSSGDRNLLVIDRRTDRPVGFCSLYDIDRTNCSGEISFLVGERKFRGKGAGKDILKGLVEIAGRDMGLKRVHATVLSTNERSLRIFEGAGFRRVGTLMGAHNSGEGMVDEVLFESAV